MNLKNSQKGVSLYLSIIVMSILLAMTLGMSAILFLQVKIMAGMGNSVIALYAADTGIERVTYAIRKEAPAYVPITGDEPCGVSFDCPSLDTGATYMIKIKSADAAATIIDSKGSYKDVNRAIEITY